MENTTSKKAPKTDDVTMRTWINNDLASAVTLLNMIRNDPDMLRGIQDVIIARIRIQEENAALQEQEGLDFKPATN